MADLHLGEWRRRYTPDRFGHSILDGTQWELEIQYNNGMKPFKVYGDNIYPYNYSDFLSLLCIDDQEDDGDEDD